MELIGKILIGLIHSSGAGYGTQHPDLGVLRRSDFRLGRPKAQRVGVFAYFQFAFLPFLELRVKQTRKCRRECNRQARSSPAAPSRLYARLPDARALRNCFKNGIVPATLSEEQELRLDSDAGSAPPEVLGFGD